MARPKGTGAGVRLPTPKSFRTPLTADEYRKLRIVRGYAPVSLCELFRQQIDRWYEELVPVPAGNGNGNGNGHAKGKGSRKAGV